MTLRPAGFIDVPAHRTDGGFDHAAIRRKGRRLYVAHTANDALDMMDLASERYAGSIEGLTGVAGALVDDASGLVFTSDRGEDTVSIFDVDHPEDLVKVPVGCARTGSPSILAGLICSLRTPAIRPIPRHTPCRSSMSNGRR